MAETLARAVVVRALEADGAVTLRGGLGELSRTSGRGPVARRVLGRRIQDRTFAGTSDGRRASAAGADRAHCKEEGASAHPDVVAVGTRMVDTIAEARFTIPMRALLVTTAFTVFALGCTGTTEQGPNAPSEEGAPPTTTAENTEGGFTVALPHGSSPAAIEKAPGQYEYTTPNGSVLVTVKPGDQAAFEAAKAQYTTRATSFGGHARGTDTQFSSAWREAETGPRSSATLLFANAKIFECTVSSTSAPTLMVCQSLKAL